MMFGALHSNALFTSHIGQSGGRGLSPRLWKNLRGQALSPDGLSNAYFAGDDFLLNAPNVDPGAGGSTAGSFGPGYATYTDTVGSAGSIKGLPTEVGGVVRVLTGTGVDDETWVTTGANIATMAKISDTAGSSKKLIFEARFRVNELASRNVYFGLAEEGLAAADTITDTGVLASKDFVGFSVTEADVDGLIFAYRKAGQALQTPFLAGNLVAGTWYKAGFIFDPDEVPERRIKVYLDNVEQGTYVSAADIAAATFPNGEELAFLAGVKNGGAGAAHSLDIDWWALAQDG